MDKIPIPIPSSPEEVFSKSFDEAIKPPIRSGMPSDGVVRSDLIREDGTPKGNGWLGQLPMQDGSGKYATELSASSSIDGKNIFYPLIVPTLKKEHLDYLLSGGKPTPEIYKLATEHALMRIKQGKSPFKD